MFKCEKFYTYKVDGKVVPIELVAVADFKNWLKKQPQVIKEWLESCNFEGKARSFCLIPAGDGSLKQVVAMVKDFDDSSIMVKLSNKLSKGYYKIITSMCKEQLARMVHSWLLGNYRFDKYKKMPVKEAKLVIPHDDLIVEHVKYVETFALVMDWINIPANDMYPEIFAKCAKDVAKEFKAEFHEIIGDNLVKNNFPAIYAVGKSSYRKPRLVEIRWGKKSDPKLTLVGKGVCFDSGGFNLKPGAFMRTMKGDMGGAAHALGLARIIMQAKLPVNLHVLLPMVENLLDSTSYKPDDVIHTRKGITVEIDNTDAEGRMILADALTYGCESKPDLLIDFATLTGAARVALGMDIPAFFTDNEKLAKELEKFSAHVKDPMCRLPIYQPYRHYLDSKIADICNSATTRYGGAIFAALFLKEFVAKDTEWLHFDISASCELADMPRPQGAAVDALRTLVAYLSKRYGGGKV